MLKPEKTVLVVIAVQGRLARLMHAKASLFSNLRKFIKGIQTLQIPILWVEQKPESLGPTITEISEILADVEPIHKSSFSAYRDTHFLEALETSGRQQVLVTGIEAHVCVYQTAVDLAESGYEVEVVADAVSSRTLENKTIGLQKMRDAGVGLTSTEMALFELLEKAEGEAFKKIVKIVK